MRKKLFYVACFLCTGGLAVPTVFGQEPTKEELFNIAKEAYEKKLWKPNANPVSQKDKGNDPVANAFKRSNFL